MTAPPEEGMSHKRMKFISLLSTVSKISKVQFRFNLGFLIA
jgi:hypothetical protein